MFLGGLGGVVLALALWPAIYLDIADRLRWRLGLPSVAQLQLERTSIALHLRGADYAAPTSTLLFGDSHLHGLPTAELGVPVTNYAIGGETAERLAVRMSRYSSVRKAGRIVIQSGANDLAAGGSPTATADFLAAAMQQVPAATPVLLVALPPSRENAVRQGAIAALNRESASRCAARPSCRLVKLDALANPDGSLRADHADHDGVHLSAAGYRVFAQILGDALRETSPGIAQEACRGTGSSVTIQARHQAGAAPASLRTCYRSIKPARGATTTKP